MPLCGVSLCCRMFANVCMRYQSMCLLCVFVIMSLCYYVSLLLAVSQHVRLCSPSLFFNAYTKCYDINQSINEDFTSGSSPELDKIDPYSLTLHLVVILYSLKIKSYN